MGKFEDLGTIRRRSDRIAAAAEALAQGALLAHPTSTVYGLGGGPDLDPEVARLKGRASQRRILRLVPAHEDVRRLFPAAEWSSEAEVLAAAFWPGPLTLVLPDGTPDGLAVRVEAHPETRAVLEVWGGALGSTSLNRSGEAPARREDEARSVLRRLPASATPVVFLPAGDLPGSPPSTILSLVADPRLLREGAVSRSRLEEALGKEVPG